MNFIPGVFLLFSTANAEEFSVTTDKALALHISGQGFSRIGEGISGLLPASISISAGSNSFECSSDTILDYSLSDMDIFLSIDETEFTTSEGTISLGVYGTLSSGVTQLTAQGDCSLFTDLDETCDIKISTTAFSLNMDIGISQANGQFVVDAGDANFFLSPITNPVGGCLLTDVIDTVLGQNPNLINDLITDAIQPELDDLPQTVKDSIEDALDELQVDSNLDLLDSTIGLSLEPSLIEIDERGVLLGMAATISTEVIDQHCVDTSTAEIPADQDWPEFDGLSLGGSLPYDTGLFIGRHFMDQILYTAWVSGALCLDVEDLTGLAFTGEFVSNYFGEELNELVGQEQVKLYLEAQKPPTTVFDDDQPPIVMNTEGFGLRLFGPVDERLSRILQVDLAADIGFKIELSNQQLSVDTSLNSDDFDISESYSELLSPGYSENVAALLDLSLENFVPELPRFTIPSFLGITVGPLVWEPSADQSWQGGYLFINTDNVTPLVIPGCSANDLACDGGGSSVQIDIEEQLGCDEAQAGCSDDAGCSTSGKVSLPTGRIFGLLIICIGVVVRRR